MNSPSITAFAPTQVGAPITPLSLMFAAILVAIGDWLFYEHELGISVALFLGAVAIVAMAANAAKIDRSRWIPALGVLVVSFAPLVEHVGYLSVAFALAGLTVFTVLMVGDRSSGAIETLRTAQILLLSGPVQLVEDLQTTIRTRSESVRAKFRADVVLRWAVPFLISALFALLFVLANPVIANWLALLSSANEVPRIGIGRLLFWIVLVAAAWPFIALRLRKAAKRDGTAHTSPLRLGTMAPGLAPILDATTIRRCLVLVNLLFALQSGLDITYLWAGATLPDGMTYAQYAHRGAYPLMLTVLLAAAFVIATMRPDGPGRNSANIRGLVYLWIGQNILLVGSAILRLDLYVASYSLTYARLAAIVWMGLVAVGLVLILVQIAKRRSNRWLIEANSIALAAALYGWALVNTPAVIADFNIAHSREAAGTGSSFDAYYALSLGPQAIPAHDRYRVVIQPALSGSAYLRDGLAADHARKMSDWRAWTFRDWRLQRYLREHNPAPSLFAPMPSPPYDE